MSKALLRFLALGNPQCWQRLSSTHVDPNSSLSYVIVCWGQERGTSLTVPRRPEAQAGAFPGLLWATRVTPT